MLGKEKLKIILNKNIGKEVQISANYTESTGEIISIEDDFLALKIDKKKIKFIVLASIYAIEVGIEEVK